MAKKKPRKRRRKRTLRIDWNGCQPVPIYRRKLRRAARIAIAKGCYITSTTGGVHSPGSYHYQGRAIDFGSSSASNAPEKRAQAALSKKFGNRKFAELFGPKKYYVKSGVRYSGTFPGHADHLHVAF
jgi:hypothetical protein